MENADTVNFLYYVLSTLIIILGWVANTGAWSFLQDLFGINIKSKGIRFIIIRAIIVIMIVVPYALATIAVAVFIILAIVFLAATMINFVAKGEWL